MFRCNVCGSVYKDEVESCKHCKAVLTSESEQTKNMWQYAKVCPVSVKAFNVMCNVIAWLFVALLGFVEFTLLEKVNEIEDADFWLLLMFGLMIAVLIILFEFRGCFKTYVYSKNAYILCGCIAAIAILEQIYILVVSGGNLGLVWILLKRQWMFYVFIVFFVLYSLVLLMYRIRINQSYRAYYMEHTGITREEYAVIRHDIEGNKKDKTKDYIHERFNIILIIAVFISLVCMGDYGIQVKKENDAYMDKLKRLTGRIAYWLAVSNEERDSFDYEMGRIEITEDDIVVKPHLRRNAAYCNAYYGMDYDIDRLDEILCDYANDMTADLDLYRFGTFVLGEGTVIDGGYYKICAWWEEESELKRAGHFVGDYIKYIEGNDTYKYWDDIPSDKLQDIMNLYVTTEGGIMARDLMCRIIFGLIDRECEYNKNGKAVSLSDAHINRPYLYVVMACTDNNMDGDSFCNQEDLGVEELCSEYEDFCSDGILKEDGLLEKLYDDYGYSGIIFSTTTMAITIISGGEADEAYAFVGDYVDSNGGSISDMEQAETLSEADYALLKEAWEAYLNR